MSRLTRGVGCQRYPVSKAMTFSETALRLPSTVTSVGNAARGGLSVVKLKLRSRSARDGVRTARDTAAHTACVGSGFQMTRRLGCTSKPPQLVYSNFEPRISDR